MAKRNGSNGAGLPSAGREPAARPAEEDRIQRRVRNRTERRSEPRAPILRLAAPALLSQASFTLTGVIDLMMVGSISPEAIAAVGMGGTLFWNLSVLFGGPAIALLYLCGQSWGRCDHGAFSRRAAAGLVLSVALSAGFALFPAVVSRFLYQAMGAADDVVEQGVRYFRFRMLGFPAWMIGLAMESAVKATGNTKAPMFIKMGSHLANIAGNYVLIFGKLGFEPMGTKGAGLSTFISELIALIGMTILLARVLGMNGTAPFRGQRAAGASSRAGAAESDRSPESGEENRDRGSLVPHAPISGELSLVLREGMKVALQGFSSSFSILVYTAMITRLGSVALAANQIAVSIISLSFLPATGLGQASEILISQYIGRGEPARARNTGYRVLLYCCGLMVLFGICIGLFPRTVGRLYTESAEVLSLLGPMLLVSAFLQILDAGQIVLSASLRATGDTGYLLWVTTAASWGLFVPLVWIITAVLGWGILWAWGARYALMLVLALFFSVRYIRKRWEDVRPR